MKRLRDQLGIGPLAAHPVAEARIVQPTAPALPVQGQHPIRLQRFMM